MQFDYKGQVVLITGAAGGFGRLAAAEFARAGAKLVLTDLDAKKLKHVRAGLSAPDMLIEAGDVGEDNLHRRLVEGAIDAYGRLDVAINNAGIAHAFENHRHRQFSHAADAGGECHGRVPRDETSVAIDGAAGVRGNSQRFVGRRDCRRAAAHGLFRRETCRD